MRRHRERERTRFPEGGSAAFSSGGTRAPGALRWRPSGGAPVPPGPPGGDQAPTGPRPAWCHPAPWSPETWAKDRKAPKPRAKYTRALLTEAYREAPGNHH